MGMPPPDEESSVHVFPLLATKIQPCLVSSRLESEATLVLLGI